MSNTFFNEESPTDAQATTQEEATIILRFGTEEVEVRPSELRSDMTIRSLVQAKAEDLGVDANRITSFRDEGVVVDGNTTIREGHVYSVAINAESKGHKGYLYI